MGVCVHHIKGSEMSLWIQTQGTGKGRIRLGMESKTRKGRGIGEES